MIWAHCTKERSIFLPQASRPVGSNSHGSAFVSCWPVGFDKSCDYNSTYFPSNSINALDSTWAGQANHGVSPAHKERVGLGLPMSIKWPKY